MKKLLNNIFGTKFLAFLFLGITFTALSSCDNEREIEFELPPYERELVVECYLEPGQPFVLSLQESVGYFENFELPLVDSALVIISHAGMSDTLQYVEIQPGIGVYIAFALVPFDYSSEFQLYIRDPQGREVTGTTRILEPVPIDTLVYMFGADNLARLEIRFSDDPLTENWYRFASHRNNLEEGSILDLALDDRFTGTSNFVLSTGFDFEVGDTAIATLYHLSEEYYNYIETVQGARDNNGNPFGQPGTIQSTVIGGIGVFTGLTYIRQEIIIQQ